VVASAGELRCGRVSSCGGSHRCCNASLNVTSSVK
jgi:hypothetical protein